MSVRVTGSIDFGRGRAVIVSEHDSGHMAAQYYLQAVSLLEAERRLYEGAARATQEQKA